MYLEKNQSLFARDKEGNLLPIDVVLDIEDKPEIKVIPLTKGEMREIQTEEDKTGQDNKIILKHCIKPKYTEEEIKNLKPLYAGAIITAILSVSTGLSQEKIKLATANKTQNFLSKK